LQQQPYTRSNATGFPPCASLRCSRVISADLATDIAATGPLDRIGDPAPPPARAAGPRQGPSFEIRSASGSLSANTPLAGFQGLRLDRINSSVVLQVARQVYFRFLSSGPSGIEPAGIVLKAAATEGRVVFEAPVLLPDEHFVPIDWLRNRSVGRNRPGRPAPSRSPL